MQNVNYKHMSQLSSQLFYDIIVQCQLILYRHLAASAAFITGTARSAMPCMSAVGVQTAEPWKSNMQFSYYHVRQHTSRNDYKLQLFKNFNVQNSSALDVNEDI